MASDHRGRDLHAGKRTAQELGWDNSTFTDGAFAAGKGIDPWRGTGSLLGNMTVWDEGNEYQSGGAMWAVTKHADTPSNANMPDSSYTDLGRGKRASKGDSGAKRVVGTTRTPARAIIAAEAMNKRIDEGRDLKTGRPKK